MLNILFDFDKKAKEEEEEQKKIRKSQMKFELAQFTLRNSRKPIPSSL